MEATKEMQKYFVDLSNEVNSAYEIVNKAKSKGYDPELQVAMPIARDLPERVEGLISVIAPQLKGSKMVSRIKELEKQYGSQDWRIAFKIAEEIAMGEICNFKTKFEAMEVGLRVGLAYVTTGSVASPLEGFVKLELKKRKDGKEYFCLYFSGPIRSAGTTATCVFVGLADYIRKKMGYAEYDPTELEIKRTVTELYDFHERITNLQYLPSAEELEFMVRYLPLQVDGDPSEKIEVSNYKNLDRIATNRLRNGVCLVFGEGLTQKAAKFLARFSKWSKEFDMEHWKFLEDFVKLQREIKAKKAEKKEDKKEEKLLQDHTFIKDLVGGRPVITYPMRTGGLRLRYGRTRTSGFSCDAIHPASMIVLNDYIGIGTQLKTERPGKSTVISSCDNIEGPIVKLKSGEVLFLETEEQAKKVFNEIEEVIFLGDILIDYGDFFNRGHKLVPCGYNEDWWLQEVKKKNKEFNKKNVKTFNEALEISKKYNIPLHPRYTFHWKDLTKEQFLELVENLKTMEREGDNIILDLKGKRNLELIGIPHKIIKDKIIIEGDWGKAFIFTLSNHKNFNFNKEILSILSEGCDVKIRDKSGTFIGARMGRPEKAKMRKLTGSPQMLFPIGEEGGRLRSLQSALEAGKVNSEFPLFFCEKCKKETIYPICEICENKTNKINFCNTCKKIVDKTCEDNHYIISYDKREINIKHYLDNAINKLKMIEVPPLVKGVRGTSNKGHIPENLCKGLLRATCGLYVNKDGTIRYDMTEMPITAFKPLEIGTSIEKLKEIGYTKDISGKELIEDNQILELRPQDVILPACEEGDDEGADVVLFRVANFVDELMERFYGLKKYYNLKTKQDLIGHLVIGIAPHICVGVIGRIIGFSKTQGCLAHPLWHSAQRRDCDGDETCVILLMDALLNFSREYLPAHRGSTQDSPLVLSTIIVPAEVDDQTFDITVGSEYPLELYEAALEYKAPFEVKVEQLRLRIGTELQYEGFRHTHEVSNLNNGVKYSAYKLLPTMEEKVMGQMNIAEKIRAVDQSNVAKLIIERHFMRDIQGNLRKFSTQEFRCVKCNEKFRRLPLTGICSKCSGKIIFTVSEGSITKYLIPSLSLAEKYELPIFLKQTLELIKRKIESIFGVEKEKQEGLGKWFG